ncbi:hypothetical protein [Psychrosphaera haliotis]|uniref:Uncharacterized protein n=1 Tax=Psychrosphaera haliotis TaxID=555083 RepID=A0A6N8FDZ0_9GAMM|nr:hypothetical protein [Psychrosphaera haliotis]MUH73200.1 hypothetical protein [Psychrosphaera haliotis]
MRIFLQIVILITSIVTVFVYAYNQGLKDAGADMLFVDASINFVALKSLRENGKEKTISFLESNLDSSIEINRNLVESRSIYFDYINLQFPVNHRYYEHMLQYRLKYPVEKSAYPTDKNLSWLISNANKRLNSDND